MCVLGVVVARAARTALARVVAVALGCQNDDQKRTWLLVPLEVILSGMMVGCEMRRMKLAIRLLICPRLMELENRDVRSEEALK